MVDPLTQSREQLGVPCGSFLALGTTIEVVQHASKEEQTTTSDEQRQEEIRWFGGAFRTVGGWWTWQRGA